jgi:hypothetical protein
MEQDDEDEDRPGTAEEMQMDRPLEEQATDEQV